MKTPGRKSASKIQLARSPAAVKTVVMPEPALRHCVALALTYHLNKRKGGRAK
jgi:hypothetical protein